MRNLFRRWSRDAGVEDRPVETEEIAIRVQREASQSKIDVSGRVTVDSSPRLRSVLLGLLRRNPPPLVTVDLSGVSYLDMSGIATLLEALKAARGRSVKLRVTGMGGHLRMLAEVTELDQIFRAAGSEVEFR
ncbi:MAG: STAS domain-containing protein [Bryobacterales bacterium]|nr:STAS domain-containing protein [Bryobacterales bacterium]